MAPVPTPGDIRWTARDEPPVVRPCTICGHPGPHQSRLTVPSLAPPHASLGLLECTRCGGLFFDPPGITDFSDLDQRRDDFWRFYAEVGGGVWETIWPLLVARPTAPAKLLDVGCGFGFAVDFWRRALGSEAIGLELADYGRVGARMLGVPIYAQYLQDCSELDGRRFDVVYASEVIEHVPDPRAFVELLANYVSATGMLVLTTPSAGFIEPKNESPTLLGALAPGFHGFLLSSQTFAAYARDAGFGHVEVRTYNERQILWASRSPLVLDFALDGLRKSYLDYLHDWLAIENSDTPVWHGYAYRYVRDMVNTGKLVDAAPVASKLSAALERAFPTPVADVERMMDGASASESLAEFGRVAPFFLPNFYYSLAVLSELLERDRERAVRYYRATEAIAVAASRFGSVFFLEATSLIWPARAALLRLALQRNDIGVAVGFASRIAREGRRPDATSGFARAERSLIESSVPAACVELARRGSWSDARAVFDDFVAYLAAEYASGDPCDADVVRDVWMGLAAIEIPGDPVFPLFFQAVLEAHESGAELTATARYRSLAALHEGEVRSAARRERLATYLRMAATLVPAKLKGFSFEYTYTLGGKQR